MFARNVSIHLKSNVLSDYTRTFENDTLPLLRKQKGFRDEITLSNPGSLDVIAISLWDSKANAEAYSSNTYPEVLRTLARMIDGTPKGQTALNAIRGDVKGSLADSIWIMLLSGIVSDLWPQSKSALSRQLSAFSYQQIGRASC